MSVRSTNIRRTGCIVTKGAGSLCSDGWGHRPLPASASPNPWAVSPRRARAHRGQTSERAPTGEARKRVCACAELPPGGGGGRGAGSAGARAQNAWRARGESRSAGEGLSEFASHASCAVDARPLRGRSLVAASAEATFMRREELLACVRARTGPGSSWV